MAIGNDLAELLATLLAFQRVVERRRFIRDEIRRLRGEDYELAVEQANIWPDTVDDLRQALRRLIEQARKEAPVLGKDFAAAVDSAIVSVQQAG